MVSLNGNRLELGVKKTVPDWQPRRRRLVRILQSMMSEATSGEGYKLCRKVVCARSEATS